MIPFSLNFNESNTFLETFLNRIVLFIEMIKKHNKNNCNSSFCAIYIFFKINLLYYHKVLALYAN